MIKQTIPQHVAIIMDGNGRWAEAQNKPRVYGHSAGTERTREIIQAASDIGIKVLTLYAFSTENWKRPEEEIGFLLKLLIRYLENEIESLHKNNVVLRTLGNISVFPKAVCEAIEKAVELTKNNNGLILNIALNYGARTEIVQAVQKACSEGKKSLTEKEFCSYLYTAGLPDPDLLIRTAGEKRISNFLLWQIAYTELIFVESCWPEFDKALFFKTLDEYSRRKRTFGGLKESI